MARLDKIYIGTNTKMYKTIEETVAFLEKLQENTHNISREQMQLFVIPSFTTLDQARKSVLKDKITIGAQNMGWEDQGQFTGEISPLMLKEVGVEVVMIGHSERRHILGETDEEENKKVRCALKHDFTTLLCIGETEREKEKDISDEVLRIQLKQGLNGIKPEQTKKLWIAYEPVWAIGINGKPASKEYASEKHKIIKDTLCDLFGEDYGCDIPVLYGGSVKRENAKEIIQMPHIDGLFIGRSAWQADDFNQIIREVVPLFFKRSDKIAN